MPWPSVSLLLSKPQVSEEKKADLSPMLKYMPAIDAKYIKSRLEISGDTERTHQKRKCQTNTAIPISRHFLISLRLFCH
jgi:hypothetical protein